MAKKNDFEGGTDGTVMTTANTNAGTGNDAASNVISNGGTGSALTYAAAAAHYGSMGGRITPAAGTSYWRWDDTLATGRWVLRRSFEWIATPSSDINLCQIYTTGTIMGAARASTSGYVYCTDTGGAALGASPTLTAGVKYVVELAATEGTTTSTGRVEFRLWRVSDGVQIHTYDSGTTRNTGTLGANRCRVGGVITGQNWARDDFDILNFQQLSSGFIGPPATGTDYTASPADSASGADSPVLDRAAPAADAGGGTDATALDRGLAPADTAGATDSAATVQALVQTPADTAGATDSVAAVRGLFQTVGDGAGATDSGVAGLALVQTVGDGAGVFDTLAAQEVGIVEYVSEQVALYDSASSEPGKGATDPASGADAVAVLQAVDRILTDLAGATDAATRLATAQQTIGEQVDLADLALHDSASYLQPADSATAADAVAALRDVTWPIVDAVGAVDSAQSVLTVPGAWPRIIEVEVGYIAA